MTKWWTVGRTWWMGAAIGTGLFWMASPWFVRSYVARVQDAVRGVSVLQPGSTYRWRAEGYASTRVGPHGMMGRTSLPDTDASTIIALWGDSQAEGVCVADDLKLWSRLQASLRRRIETRVDVLPLARSGDDAADWSRQLAAVEAQLSVDAHVVLLTDLQDLAEEPPQSNTNADGVFTSVFVHWLPNFVVHAFRRVIDDPATGARRRLRFSFGPVASLGHEASTLSLASTSQLDDVDSDAGHGTIDAGLRRLVRSADRPIFIVHAANRPLVMGNQIHVDDGDPESSRTTADQCRVLDIGWLDVGSDLVAAWQSDGVMAFGFHHGRLGSGHLNANGYEVIAESAANWLASQSFLREKAFRRSGAN
ncbi:MAG: hypothetical protein AAF670_01705 [Planctomycetota bacterium]